jgi:hypothetical protein
MSNLNLSGLDKVKLKTPILLNSIDAGKAFQQFKETSDASDYITLKKAKAQNLKLSRSDKETFKKKPETPILLNSIEARKAFRQFKETTDARDYINLKKAKAQHLNYGCCGNQINPYDLYVNLISKLDLEGVSVIESNNAPFSCPTTIDPSGVPFLDYVVDPSGTLFGNTPCGLYNYVELMVYNPPTNTT